MSNPIITPLTISDVKLLTVDRYHDPRGYFMEVIKTDFLTHSPELPSLQGKTFAQSNESSSTKGVVRGLHAQCQPALDKILRVLQGTVIDIAVDIRPASPTFGQAVAYEVTYDPNAKTEKMICIPFGFAHGFIAVTDCRIQYFQTAVWNKDGESAITIRDPDIDWRQCSTDLQQKIQEHLKTGFLSEKDAAGLTLNDWKNHPLVQYYS